MGWSFSMALVKGRTRAEVLDALDMVETAAPPSMAYGSYAVSQTQNGWVVLYARDFDALWHDELAVLSQGGDAIGFRREERVMVSDAWGYQGGCEQWAILYDSEKGRDVRVRGRPPVAFDSIRANALERQAVDKGVDLVIDIPADVLEQVCGHAFDEILSDFEGFTAVERAQDPTRRRPGLGGLVDQVCYVVVASLPVTAIVLAIPAFLFALEYEEMASLWLPLPVAAVLAFATLAAVVIEIVRRARAFGRRRKLRARA